MFTKSIPFAFILSALLFASCQSESSKKWEETMKVHDEVMLKMQRTGDIGMKIDALLINAVKSDSTSILFSKIDTLKDAYSILEQADEEMMDWMATIQKPRKGDNQDSITNYLDLEQKAIIEVGLHMDNAIAHGELLIQSLEK